jgi:hypothetical protein
MCVDSWVRINQQMCLLWTEFGMISNYSSTFRIRRFHTNIRVLSWAENQAIRTILPYTHLQPGSYAVSPYELGSCPHSLRGSLGLALIISPVGFWKHLDLLLLFSKFLFKRYNVCYSICTKPGHFFLQLEICGCVRITTQWLRIVSSDVLQ